MASGREFLALAGDPVFIAMSEGRELRLEVLLTLQSELAAVFQQRDSDSGMRMPRRVVWWTRIVGVTRCSWPPPRDPIWDATLDGDYRAPSRF